ncbi:glycosyltransferase family 2 protein [Pseudahrensia aquimaris]|uniref:Glycosyltransferase family 2 protein n=1 Tax=Pseudahrensia aquimaris TaxID=744461 RepID=A0ABW3FG27_9HYPH
MPDLTIIIPAYNMHDTVSNAVESVLIQKIEAQIIVIDDGSLPPITLPEDVAAHPLVTLLTLPSNGGAAAARNAGVTRVKTDWLAFLDADDTLIPDTLHQRFEFAKAMEADAPLALFGCGWLEATRKIGQQTRIPLGADTARHFASGCWYCPGSCIIARRQVFVDLPFDESLSRLEDFDFGIRFGKSGGQLLVQPIAGAAIRPANRTDTDQVARAAKHLRTKHTALAESDPDAFSAMNAYLELELGTASARESRWVKALGHHLRSFAYKPRITRHFSPGWTFSQS